MGRGRGAEARTVETVYDELAPAVLGYFRSHRMAEPEDLTGDVFVAVARRLHAFEGDDAALRRWVFTIAHNVGVDDIRRRSRRNEVLRAVLPEAITTDDVRFDPELVAALAGLTDDQRQVVVLRHVADLSIAEVATITGRSAGSVKMLAARGLETLAERLAAPAPEDEVLPAGP